MNLNRLDYQYLPIHLIRDGMQFKHDYTSLNPQQLVPLLEGSRFQSSQSFAIIEYLDDKFLAFRLPPSSIEKRAPVRQIAMAITCDIQPLHNLRVLKHLTGTLGV